MDTVKLEGKYFNCKVKTGDTIKKGDILLEFDMNAIQSAGYTLVTPMVICNSDDYNIDIIASGEIQTGVELIRFKKNK